MRGPRCWCWSRSGGFRLAFSSGVSAAVRLRRLGGSTGRGRCCRVGQTPVRVWGVCLAEPVRIGRGGSAGQCAMVRIRRRPSSDSRLRFGCCGELFLSGGFAIFVFGLRAGFASLPVTVSGRAAFDAVAEGGTLPGMRCRTDAVRRGVRCRALSLLRPSLYPFRRTLPAAAVSALRDVAGFCRRCFVSDCRPLPHVFRGTPPAAAVGALRGVAGLVAVLRGIRTSLPVGMEGDRSGAPLSQAVAAGASVAVGRQIPDAFTNLFENP